jgi:hypothetical protein
LRAREPRPYLDKKFPRVQVGAKLVVSPPAIFFSATFKKQAVDLGGNDSVFGKTYHYVGYFAWVILPGTKFPIIPHF